VNQRNTGNLKYFWKVIAYQPITSNYAVTVERVLNNQQTSQKYFRCPF